MRIGVGITTHNRYPVFKSTYDEIKRLTPGAKIVVVDDASTDIVEEATHRFDVNVGVARAKNKCLELLDDCEHIFLFDDDTYPLVKDWWKPYVESPEQHLMLNFTHFADGTKIHDAEIVYKDDNLVAQSHSRGCMLYVERRVLDVVGGFDTAYGLAMYEHVDWSRRIYNAGLTRFAFADVPDSEKLIHNIDYHTGSHSVSSINITDRRALAQKNSALYNVAKKGAAYKEYRESRAIPVSERAVITSYFTCGKDVQRDITWEPDRQAIQKLIDSVVMNGEYIYILNDCGWNEQGDGYEYVPMKSYGNPYFWRWKAEYDFMRTKSLRLVWLVDATDVEMLRSPFEVMETALYSGDEPGNIRMNPWFRTVAVVPELRNFTITSSNPVLNCGLVGGPADQVAALCKDLWDYYCDSRCLENVEMPVYNHLLRDKRVVHGIQVNTKFKGFEPDNQVSWWRHK